MTKNLMIPITSLMVLMAFVLFGAVSAMGEQSQEDLITQEESGIEMPGSINSAPISVKPHGSGLVTNTIPQDSVLLIPNSTNDDVGMYDPFDGTFLGTLLTDTTHLSTPINAMKGPDGNIYLSDQIGDGVFVYDTSGTYLYTYCDGSDGLNNVRGIDFRNDTLFVTSGDDYVAMFDAPHSRLSDFINGGINPFDIYFLEDGRSLVGCLAATAGVRLYDVDGTFISQVISVSFPEQSIYDDLAPGDYLNASFSSNIVSDFDLDGTTHQTTPLSGGRGVYRLGNGNLLVTSSAGVREMEPGTGNVIEVENTGSARFIELFVVESGPPPTGRCCYNNYQDCVDTTQSACTALNGVWDGALNCTDDPCPAVGRCCYNNNADCVDTLEAACTAIGGTWSAGLNCIDDPCPAGGGCDYVDGDVNASDNYNGLDITYGVNFFKYGTPDPLCNPDCPPCQGWHYCGDVNASCNYNGLDITYGVNYFKYGSPAPQPCDDCPPIQ